MLLIPLHSYSKETPYMQKFEMWGTLKTGVEKIEALTAFTNGFFYSRPDLFPLYTCISQNASYAQATAMVDKYYAASPEKWDIPFAKGVMLALTVKDGPCPLPPSAWEK
jgi:hypothetical protein